MKFRKLAVGLSVIALANVGAPTIKVFANEVNNGSLKVERTQEHTSSMKKFDIEKNENFDQYKEVFKVKNELIESVSANGGKYGSSTPEKAIDEDIRTHWETGTPNSESFTNEFTVTFKDIVNIDKMTYKVRQDSGTKGFLNNYEIYASKTLDGDDFTLVTKGTGTSTKDTVEIKFNETDAKRIKIKFVGADANWASMSEVGFYKKDIVKDSMDNLFTDSNKNQVSEEFRDINKLNELENLAKVHPFYGDYKNQIEDAKVIVENNKITSGDAKTKQFTHYNNSEYNKLFKMDNSNIESIKNNGGHYSSRVIGNAIDGDLDTYWETNKSNSDNFNNEVEITFKDRVVLDRVIYGARQVDTKGFAEEFEIYASNTSQGDTYQLVSTGKHNRVSGLIEAKFEPTEFKRVKFKFKKSNQDWATANEFAFYKEDEMAKKVETLFTDDTLSVVSEEFNTIEKIDALEEEVKNHPLYNEFKESIENAKALVSKGVIEATTAVVSTFNLAHNEEYNKIFKMDSSNVKSIKNNGGNYASSVIGNAVDGDLNTFWETNTTNTDSFKNEIEIEFKETIELNRIVYGARSSDARGFAREFDIYASTTTKGDTYELVSTGKCSDTTDLIEAKFEPTKFRRVKFVFKNAKENWPTAREFIFYKEDKISDEINNMFVDNTYSELKEEYKNIDKINELEQQALKHPLKDKLIETINLAKKMLDGNVDYSKTTITANQHGDMIHHARSVLSMNSSGQNLQATGLYALPGDKITVYLDANANSGKMPVLQFSQNEGSWRGWRKGIRLHPGKNEIIVPDASLDWAQPTNPKPGGAIYIENPYTPEEQGSAPIIRIEGAERFPFFKEGDNEEEFKEFLVEYKKKLDEDNKTGANKVLDILAVESDRMLISGTATGAYDAYINKGVNPSDTTDFWDGTMDEVYRYYGLDGSSEIHDAKYLKEHIMFAQPHGYMYAWIDHVGVQGDVMASMLIPEHVMSGPWGFLHETGHRMDTRQRIWGEVTNNMLPMYMGHLYGNPDTRIDYKSIYKKGAPSEREDLYNNGRYFESLGMFWQLQLYNEDYWADINKLYRERKPSITDDQHKMDTMIEYSSEVFNRDLTEYFYRHGFRASEETKKKLADKYEPLEKKVWYLNDTAFRYKGEGLSKEVKPKIDELKLDGTISISSDINKDELLGYEILRDGEVIGFITNDTFKDETREDGVEYKYQVVAYGKDLSTSSPSDEMSSLTPNIKLQQTKIYVGLGEKFDALDYVKALNYNADDISEKIKVDHDVDTSKKGEYTVTYSVEDNNITTKNTMIVEVVSDIDYLSDNEWESVETQFGTPRRNSNIKGRVNGDIKEFEKGIGIHANGKVVYDLEGKNYDNFEALLGVDMNTVSQETSSVTFKIIGDGEVLATTKVIKHADDMIHVNVPVKGVKKLTIEVYDGGNGNSYDHTIIANPKLTNNNMKPSLEIEDSVSVKVGESIENVIGNVKAYDTEDGDLTDKVVVSGHENINFNKPGEYKITYTVTDSDGNSVTKERSIAIVNMNDFKFLTDYDWTSAVQSYSTTKRDTSVGGDKLKLTSETGSEVVYDRGIGSHANATIIYDLSDKNYEYFTSFIGVDRVMYNRPGSVSFEVHVDGEMKYDSGLMNAKDPQKFIEVDINGAKELKLIVKDGGNGNGSDHATWGDAKLHFVNNERIDLTNLKDAIEKAEAIDINDYTEESINNLNLVVNKAKELLSSDFVSQEQCDEAIQSIEDAISKLEVLDKVIVIQDKGLEAEIKRTLNIGDREITLADMHKLVSLE
ncbi:MAG: NPCBM/NEW2 domain-containing protein, partial [Romboutsia sp.]|uniref:NPCBM/NEW2 domain-containing protein n=1 Tax=Romboutsia sp. TaxID=1965302 RepID=UPI003F3B8BA4